MKLPYHINRFRLGFWTPGHTEPNPAGGRSLSRLFGPFNPMVRQDRRLEVVRQPFNPENPMDLPDWDWLGQLDCLYLLDPFTKFDQRLIALARANGVPVWVDYIDDLQNVPPSNDNFMHFADRAKVRANMADIIAAANVVTTTTFTLKCRLPSPEKAIIIPESCRWPACDLPRQRVVTWRGSQSHVEDIEFMLPQLEAVVNLPQFSRWKWVFIGFDKPNWKISKIFRNPEQLEYVPWLPPFDFINTWGGYAPYLHLSPIVDNPFNRSKTPLAWLEATAVGAAVIGPALPEWNACPGLIRYETPEQFGEILKQELFSYVEPREGETGLHTLALNSRAAVYPARTLPVVNELRWAIINKLCGEAEEVAA